MTKINSTVAIQFQRRTAAAEYLERRKKVTGPLDASSGETGLKVLHAANGVALLYTAVGTPDVLSADNLALQRLGPDANDGERIDAMLSRLSSISEARA
jgi:hypothetical protein